MDSAQIEKWAAEADMECGAESLYIGTTADLTRFAELVAASELERMAKRCDEISEDATAEAAGCRSKQAEATHFGFARGARSCAAAIRNNAGRGG